jgi:hypothetical protein
MNMTHFFPQRKGLKEEKGKESEQNFGEGKLQQPWKRSGCVTSSCCQKKFVDFECKNIGI